MPRPMRLRGEPVRAVVTHDFIVAPGQRGGMAAIHLQRALHAAGPDLVLADENESSRRVSEALGGTVLVPRSERWLRVFRPGRLALHLLERRRGRLLPSVLRQGADALAALPDAFARAVPGSPVGVPRVRGEDEALDAEALRALFERLTQHLALRPAYDAASLTWLLRTLRRTRQDQELRVRAVPDEDGGWAGWYVYYSRPGRIGAVLQLGATPDSRRRVLDHLFADALRQGNAGVSGQTDPAWTRDLKQASCIIRSGSTWLIMHTSNPEIRRALATSDAFLTRLESEAWLHFAY